MRRDLRAILADGATFSLMVGAGETYLPAFALAVGMGEVAAGLVATLPLVAGALLQLASPLAVRRLRSYRRWVVLCACCQALSFIPLVVAAIVGNVPPLLVYAMAAVYWGAGMGTGPAWNTWMGTLVPVALRARFFARRTRISQACVLTGFLLGGITLQIGASRGYRVDAFALCFLGAAICRLLSAAFLWRQSEPAPPSDHHRNVPVVELLRRHRSQDGALLLYFLSMQAAVQVSGPYFTPFMLDKLKLSYAQYAVLVGSAFLAKVVMLPILGRCARAWGPRRLLWIGGVGVIPLASLWLLSNSFEFLLFLQVAGGATWAAYELAMLLLFIEAIRADERTSVLTTYNVGHALATAVGALGGGAILYTLNKSHTAYLTIFALSSALRVLCLGLLARVPEPSGKPAANVLRSIALRVLALRPTDDSVERPILAGMEDDDTGGAVSEADLPLAKEVSVADQPRRPRPRRDQIKSQSASAK